MNPESTTNSATAVGKWKPYTRYEYSALAFGRAGRIPAHWRATSLKRFGAVKGGAGFPVVEQGLLDEAIPFYRVSDMNLQGNEVYMANFTSSVSLGTAKQLGAHIFERGTIIFPKVGAALLTNKRRILHTPACMDNNVMGFTVGKGEVKWFYYWLHNLDLTQLANPGAVPSVNESQLADLLVAVPPICEQRTIADFLDRETAKIDTLVAKREELIALLEEKRAALITRAVTKGLNPSVPMKDSGVEWLGMIPHHWKCRPLKCFTGFINGAPFKPSEWSAEGIPIIRIENLNLSEDFNYTKLDVDPKYEVHEGDLLFGWSGNRGTSFGPFIWKRPGPHYLNQHIFRLTGYKVMKEWFYWALRAVTVFVEKQAHGIIGLVHITKGDLGAIPIPEVALNEQQAVAAFLDRETAKIDVLMDKIREGDERLKEYRSALISAAVTGKIDVRGEMK